MSVFPLSFLHLLFKQQFVEGFFLRDDWANSIQSFLSVHSEIATKWYSISITPKYFEPMPVKITAICRVIYVICFYSNCKIVGFLIYSCPFCKTVLFKSNYKTYMHDKTNNNLAAILFIIRKTDLVNFFVLFFTICL